MDDTGVANMCLGRLGVSRAIGALTENSVEAKTCNRFFQHCRQEVLRSHPWGFALRAEALAIVADQSFPGWGYVYQSPSRSLMIRSIADANGIRVMRDAFLSGDSSRWEMLRMIRVPWQIALKDDGASQVILCDLSDAWAFHTVDVDNIGAWPADAVSVFAWRLAMEVGGPLSAKAELVERAESRYGSYLSWATANNMNEQKDDARAESPSIACRA